MLTLRRSEERGRADHGWLDTRHTFSFADYQDPRHRGFRALRVLNEDRVAAGQGFGEHGHRDMEILTYVLEGALAHRDSLGNGTVIRPHEVQLMSAGTGVLHSELNPSPDTPAWFLQIWIRPDQKGLEPRYEQRLFPPEEKRGRLRLVAAPDGAEGAVTIRQDARVYASVLDPGAALVHALAPGRGAWVQVIRGRVVVHGAALEAGDGAALEQESAIALRAEGERAAELLLFDLA